MIFSTWLTNCMSQTMSWWSVAVELWEDMDTQHAYSLRQLYSRRQTKPGSGLGVTESRSLEGLGSHREDRRYTGGRLFQGLHIPRAGSRSLGQDIQMSENKSTILHIPSIPTPDYHQESQNQPNPPLIPPNLNFEREEYSHARNIWGNADRYKGTISDKKRQPISWDVPRDNIRHAVNRTSASTLPQISYAGIRGRCGQQSETYQVVG